MTRPVRVWAAMVAVALVSSGCDAGLAPEDVAGLYRLVSVDGLHLPAAHPGSGPVGVSYRIERGELLLLPGGTIEFAIATGLGPGGLKGSFSISGSTLAITPEPAVPNATYAATIASDAITMVISSSGGFGTITSTLVWERFTRRPPQVEAGRYVLSAVNGAGPPFIVSDVTDQNGRYVQRVDFDSLELRHGVFFTRHWREVSIFYPPVGDSLMGSEERMTVGTFLSQRDTVTLMDYWLNGQLGAELEHDHLKVTATGLERRLTLLGPVVQTFLRY